MQVTNRARRFQFTLNEIDKYPTLVDAIKSNVNYKAMISCKETAPSSGHVHVHIYAYTATIPAGVSPTVEAFLYIMYLPEGVGVATVEDEEVDYVLLNALVLKHPEWILAWRHFGSDAAITSNSPTDVQRIQFSSRLKRNLNSGDRVCAVLIAHTHHATASFSRLECHGMCQFWTCSN